MIDIMEKRKTTVLRVLTDISEAKSISDGDPSRSYKDISDTPPSFEDLRSLPQSKKLLQNKNQLHPLFANHPYRCASMYGPRASSSRPGQKLKDISQRIVSAKLLQIKELRNQLTLTQHQLNEVTNENRFLKTLQKRQEIALRKYEGHEARLPQLIQSHNEEVRILNTKLKQLKHTNQRLVDKLKLAEQQLSCLQEQNCHLTELSRNQQLGERESLAIKVEELQHTVRDQNNTIQLLNRKVDLERKNYKHELGIERSKRSEIEQKLSLAMQTIENLKDQIEAKEKCMSAIVPSRYVRTSHSLSQVNQPTTQTARFTHTTIPRTPHNQNTVNTFKNSSYHIQTPRRSSTDQTGDETDIPESRNGNETSGSSRTISATKLPKIKPQIPSKNVRSQFKLSTKRMVKEKSSTDNNSPDYSSSFASEDISLKDSRKNSEFETEKITETKCQMVINSQRNSSKSRKFSVDSGVINRSESGKITQRTDQSRISSSKSRRNSISICPPTSSDPKDVEAYLEKDSMTAKLETHKSIREELRELEEKLLQGTKFLSKSANFKSDMKNFKLDIEEDQSKNEKYKCSSETLINGESEDESNDELEGNLNTDSWNEIHNKIKAESEASEAKLEEYYNNLEKSELNLDETENYIALEEEQKEKLLKALKEIDKESKGISSDSSPDETPSSSQKPTRRKSDGYRYSFSRNVDNLHRGRPVYEKVKIPAVEKMRKEEKDYLSDIENNRKNKADFMKELFNNFDDQNDKMSASERHTEDIERLVQLD